jgi:flavin reductase (DIM6/NTAB) family NADH-FMN oxidoreductase RutF
MAAVCSPVSVVTTVDREGPYGVTVSSLASLSAEPALVSIALDRRSRVLERILAAGRFGLNILSVGQADVAAAFARPGVDRFGACPWSWSQDLPRLDGAAAWAVCDLWQTWEGGDHLLLAGFVEHAVSAPLPPLVYGHRTFGTHSQFGFRPRRPIVERIAACAR